LHQLGLSVVRKLAMLTDMVELQIIQGLSGETLATLHCPMSTRIHEVKQRLSCQSDAPGGRQQLTLGFEALDDGKTLEACGIIGPTATLQFVRVAPSGLARHLEAKRDAASPDEALDACMTDIVDSVMQAEYEQAERHMPCVKDILRVMSTRRRGELVSWMVQAFEALSFTDEILHSTVHLLDRYYAKLSAPLPDSALHKTLLGAVCTQMKLESNTDFPSGHWQRVVAHLSQGRLSVPTILTAERGMLATLNFAVGIPTPLTFLQGLGVRIRQEAAHIESSRWISTALFILELALFEPKVQYAYSHAVLAAAALNAALRTCGAPPEKHDQVLEDLSIYCPVPPHTNETIVACEEDLLTLWLQSSRGENGLGDFYIRLEAKFSHRAQHSFAHLSPEAALRRHREATSPRSSASTTSGEPSSPTAGSTSPMSTHEGEPFEIAVAFAAGGA
jgi:hypothetical protein